MLEKGNNSEAYKYFLKATKNNEHEESATAHFGLMVAVERETIDSKGAIYHLEEKLSNEVDNFKSLTHLAILKFFNYEDIESMDLLHKALKENNTYIPALVAVGEILRSNG